MTIKQGPLPFVIGVTGHRDLRNEDRGSLKQVVGNIIDEFRKRMPHTPLIILLALAEGADRLVSEVALAKNVRIIVPLPMKQSEYEKDFDSSSLTEFRGLISQIAGNDVFELPLVNGSTEKDLEGDRRNLQYAQAGQYIVLHSHIVLALWDGLDPDKVGGTADVVKMCLIEGRMEELLSGSAWLNYEDECGPVYQVLTPRRDACASPPPDMNQLFLVPGTAPAMTKLIFPDGTDKKFRDSWKRVDLFNRDCISRHKSILNVRSISLDTFRKTDSGIVSHMSILTNVFVAADEISKQLKHSWERTVFALQIIVVLSLLLFTAAKNLAPLINTSDTEWTTVFWGGFIICVAGAYGVWLTAHSRQIQNRFLDYRGLAEALRVQFNWNVAGIRDIEVADCYLRYQTESFAWLRTAARVCCIGVSNNALTNEASRLRGVFENWVKDQSEYFNQTTPKRVARSRQLTQWAMMWVLLAMSCTVVLWHNSLGSINLGSLTGLFKMLSDFMFGTAAVVVGYAAVLAVEDESRRFLRMRIVYDRARRLSTRYLHSLAETPEGISNARKIIHELGKEALEENGDWIVLHRSHPLGMPRWGTEIGILMKSITGKFRNQVKAEHT